MYIATYAIDIAALFYLIGLLHNSTTLHSTRKKPLLAATVLTVIIILSEAGTIFTNDTSMSLRSINIFCNVLGFALTPLIPIAISLIFDKRILSTHKFLLVPTLINIVATVLSPLFKYIFYVNASNQYIRGDYFFIFISVYIFNFLFLIICTLDVGKKHNYHIAKKMILLSLFTIIGTSIQIVYPLAYSSWHCITLSLFLYFLLMSQFDNSFDILTGLYNRVAFENASKEIVRAKVFSIIVLDIDDFKSINDTYGHDRGDAVIKAVAAIIRESFYKHYTCYRIGGDEFYILSNETDQEKIELQLKAMTNALVEMRGKGNPLPTVSYGYSIFRGGDNADFNINLKEADDQMYHYKKVHKAT